MMRVRPATAGDFPQAEALLGEFMKESLKEFGAAIEKRALSATMRELVSTSLVLENGDGKLVGLLAGRVIANPMDGSRIFQEVVWYVSKAHRTHGIMLLREMEAFCRIENISTMIMVHIGNSMPEKLARLYERMGYKHLECHYIKRINI